MAFRIHFYNDVLGNKIIENDPIGINDLTKIIKRSAEHEGIVFEVIVAVEFIKDGKAYLNAAYENAGGIDAVVFITFFELNVNTRIWEHFTSGKIDFKQYDKDDVTISVNIDKVGIENKILNLIDLTVDQEGSITHDGRILPAHKLFNVPFHSKVIVKESKLAPADNKVKDEITGEIGPAQSRLFTMQTENLVFLKRAEAQYNGFMWYVPIDTTRQIFTDLTNVYPSDSGQNIFYPGQIAGSGNVDLVNPGGSGSEMQYINYLKLNNNILNARTPLHIPEEIGVTSVDIQIRSKHKIVASANDGNMEVNGLDVRRMAYGEVTAWYERRNSADVVQEIKEVGRWLLSEKPSNEVSCDWETKSLKINSVSTLPGDKFYVYQNYRVYGYYNPGSTTTEITHDLFAEYDPEQTLISFNSATSFGESVHEVVLIYEAVKRCCQFLTGVEDCLYSELLGRTDLGYAVDGEASLLGITSGNKLRSLNDKHILIDLETILEFLNARYRIGYGFENVNGLLKFRIEKLKHFYNKDLKIITLTNVANVREKLINELYWNESIYGYGPLDIEQQNAIDEYNTGRKTIIPIVNTKNKLTFVTTLHGSGYMIEKQRRLTGKKIDSRLDDQNFIISLVRFNNGFKTKSIEGYDVSKFVNIIFPESQYNFDLSPGRMLEASGDYIASCLIRSRSKLLKFSSGEVNYKMGSQQIGKDMIYEDQDLNLSGRIPIWDPTQITFTHKLTREEIKIVEANNKGYLEIIDKDGFIREGFIHTGNGIKYHAGGLTDFTLLKVNRKVLDLSTEEPRPRTLYSDLVLDNLEDYARSSLDKTETQSNFLRSLIKWIKI